MMLSLAEICLCLIRFPAGELMPQSLTAWADQVRQSVAVSSLHAGTSCNSLSFLPGGYLQYSAPFSMLSRQCSHFAIWLWQMAQLHGTATGLLNTYGVTECTVYQATSSCAEQWLAVACCGPLGPWMAVALRRQQSSRLKAVHVRWVGPCLARSFASLLGEAIPLSCNGLS